MAISFSSCVGTSSSDLNQKSVADSVPFNYHVDSFYDVEVLRYKVPSFEELTLNQKLLIYYLSQAALEGRDILFQQNCIYNLEIRKICEKIYTEKIGAESKENFSAFENYLKRIWFSNGIHHHYSCDKFLPDFSKDWFVSCLEKIENEELKNEIAKSWNLSNSEDAYKTLLSVMFDPSVAAKRVNQADGEDLIATSANNYYQNVSQKEVEDFYNKMRIPNDKTPISYGLNSTLVKDKDGKIVEKVWKLGGEYSQQIEKILFWLEKALPYAENDLQSQTISQLIDYYKSGDLKKFDEYSITWVKDSLSRVDFVNGFIETYGDPLGIKASWESIVNFKDLQATRRSDVLSENAQWFEDNSPVASEFKKKECKGVSAKVINAAILGGDCYPATPIGINLPNANWIREVFGSKSVTIENITSAYHEAAKGNGFHDEFVVSDFERNLIAKYGFQADNIHTDLHECLGHGSGRLSDGVTGDELGVYGATIEEARADLFGLYYAADAKMVELGLLPDSSAYKSEYYTYLMNGLLTQLVRINLGDNIEEAHMRNRALISHWVLEKGSAEKVVELQKIDGKTFVKVNDYQKLRSLFGDLLAEIQRIKSMGDFNAARVLVENYAVKIDSELHKEIKERYSKLNIKPYKGFVNPVYHLIEEQGKAVDVKVTYDESYTEQMLRYSNLK
ncbi:MAG: hypothetical protein HUJ62_01325 [Streptococcus gallolyticus]|nr:hypothetical protein [Streptococcus gallolyticus]